MINLIHLTSVPHSLLGEAAGALNSESVPVAVADDLLLSLAENEVDSSLSQEECFRVF